VLGRALAVVDRLWAGSTEGAVDSTSNAVDCTSNVEVDTGGAGGAGHAVDNTSSADRPNSVDVVVDSTSSVGIVVDNTSFGEVVVDSTNTVEVVAVVVVTEDNNDFQRRNKPVGDQECNCWSYGCR